MPSSGLLQALNRWNEKKIKESIHENNIYEFELQNLNIIPRQKVMASNVAIGHVNSEIIKLRTKYIS